MIFAKRTFLFQVVKTLLLAMDDYPNPRVQSHAGAALVNFSEECPKHILAPYLDTIIEKLEQVLSATFQQVRHQCSSLQEQ